MAVALDASVSCLDTLIESNELSRIREIKMDFDDANKVVLYLRGIISMLTNAEQKREMLELCFDICVSHGLLSMALEYALMMQFSNGIEKVRELMLYCYDISIKPYRPCAVSSIEASSWKPVAAVSWNWTEGEKERQLRQKMKLQLGYQLAEHRFVPDYRTLMHGPDADESMSTPPGFPEADEELDSILRRDYVSGMFDYLTGELDVVAPKNVEDVIKSEDNHRSTNLEAGRNSLVLSYGNGFLHSGYGVDYGNHDEDLIQKTRNHGLTASIATIGLINLWRVDQGLSELDKYQYSQDNYTRSGALIGFGLCNCGTYNDCDPVLSLVSDSLLADDPNERMAAYISLGYAYCGAQREDIFNLLLPAVLMSDSTLEVSSIAALSLGLIFAGSANHNLVEILVQSLVDRPSIDTIHVYNYAIAIGLIYLNTRYDGDQTIDEGTEDKPVAQLLEKLNHPIAKFIKLMIQICSYAASGDILKCQMCLQQCLQPETEKPAADAKKNETGGETQEQAEPVPGNEALPGNQEAPPAEIEPPQPAQEEEKDESSQTKPLSKLVIEELENVMPGLALIGYTLMILGEPIGEEMLLRMVNHMLQYDSVTVRRAVPLALALHSASSAKPGVVDILSKLTHDNDADTALHAIVSLGIVAAGTNNARVAQILRGLASFYSVDADGLFLVKMAQGLVHSGKGLHTLSPLHADKKLVIRNSLACLIAFAVQGLFTQETLCRGRYHMNILHLALAIRPRWLVTIDESGKPIPVPVRVGQFVDVAGTAGQPRQVAGFRTYNTPILLSDGEKAEMGSPDWQPLTTCLEGIVIVRKTDPAELKDAIKSLE